MIEKHQISTKFRNFQILYLFFDGVFVTHCTTTPTASILRDIQKNIYWEVQKSDVFYINNTINTINNFFFLFDLDNIRHHR